MDFPLPLSTQVPIPLLIEPDADACAVAVAGKIAELIRLREREGRRAVLGLATGATPRGVYRELIALHKQGLSFRHVVTFNLDEYYPVSHDDPRSYHRYMADNLFSHIDILPENVHLPSGDLPLEDLPHHCLEYESQITNAGGIDLQILGIGRTGHIGFNEPGSSIATHTRLIALDALTRNDAAPAWGGLDHVPQEAVTMGVGTILEARRVILMALGASKAEVIARALLGPVTRDLPASLLQQHGNALCVLDRAAAAKIAEVIGTLGTLEMPSASAPSPDNRSS